MADLKLERPKTSTKLELSANAEDDIVFNFNINEAVMSRQVDSNALTFAFNDGSTTVITNFYAVYTSDNMPDFIIGDQVVDGETFFASFDENLMPAAGPGAGATRSGGSFEFGSDDLASGNSALGEVYIKTFSGSVQPHDDDDDTGNSSTSNENTDGDSGVIYVAPVITLAKFENANLDATGALLTNHNIVNQNFSSTDDAVKTVKGIRPRAPLSSIKIFEESSDNGNSFYATAITDPSWGKNGNINGKHGSLGNGTVYVTKEESSDVAFTMTSVKVAVDASVEAGKDMTPTVEKFGEVGYRQYDEGKGGSGIMVISDSQSVAVSGVVWDNEISARNLPITNKDTGMSEYISEGIMFDIPGNDVHNITLSLTAFYVSWADVEGQETATIYFYKGDSKTAIHSEQITSQKDSGVDTGRFTYEGYIADGFDKVLLKPDPIINYKFGSSFLIESISFSESILPSYTGQLTYDLGTGPQNGGIAFILENKSILETDQGDLDISIVENPDNSVTMTGKHHDDDGGFKKGSEAFTTTLDPNGKWTFESTQDITVNNGQNFELGFEVTGKNGSTAQSSVELDVIIIDSYKVGTDTNDTILSSNTEANDYIKGLDGDDNIFGNKGDDKLFGDEGNDKLFGDEGDDIIFGGGGDDIIKSGDDNDVITGGAGADELYGDKGNDVINFDLNDIVVDGGEGNDVAIGGTIDGILGNLEAGIIENIELFLTGDGSTSIADMGDLDNIGISFEAGDVNFDKNKWTQGDITTVSMDGKDTTYVEVTSGQDDEQIIALVNQAIFTLNYNT